MATTSHLPFVPKGKQTSPFKQGDKVKFKSGAYAGVFKVSFTWYSPRNGGRWLVKFVKGPSGLEREGFIANRLEKV